MYIKKKKRVTVIHQLMLHHHSVLHSYNITHEHFLKKMNRQICSNILYDPPHKISSKMDNFWMYYSQIIFGHYVFSPNVTLVFYVYLTQKSINQLHISETYSH